MAEFRFIRHTNNMVRDWGRTYLMWEKLILAAVATCCFYLFLQLGGNTPESNLFGGNLTKTPSFIFNLPLFSR